VPLPAGPKLPAQQFPELFGRRAIGVKKSFAVEMIGDRANIDVFGGCHGTIGPKNVWFGKG
jgi:hypothetical protein